MTLSALLHRARRSGRVARTPRPPLQDLGPVEQLRAGRLGRRLAQLVVGLALYGVSLAMMVRAELGAAPWDVLHLGIARHVPLTLGQVLVVVAFALLVLWVPLREKPGIGTVANAVLIGIAADATLAALPPPGSLTLRVPLMLAGVALCALATALYIGSQLGRGPRDGLMTACTGARDARCVWSARLSRSPWWSSGSRSAGPSASAPCSSPWGSVR
jgi:uncharacterized membrane protein YczE